MITPRKKGCARVYAAGAALVVLLVVHVSPASGWEWPIAPLQSLLPGTYLGPFGYRLIPAAGTGAAVRDVAEGAVIFSQERMDSRTREGSTGVPRMYDTTVQRHNNEFWSITAVPPRDARDTREVPWAELALWDGVTRRQINPRAMLPPLPVRELSGTAFLAVLQNGVSVRAADVEAGEIVIALLDPPSVAAALPQEARILLRGEIIGTHQFFFADDTGPVELVRTVVPPGVTLFAVEYLHFDRVVAHSVLRITARPPPLPDTP